MAWKKGVNRKGKNTYYSIINKLKKEKKINREFEITVSNLSLEELIALKLELSTQAVSGKLYGFQIWESLPKIIQEAALKYAVSATRTGTEAMSFLGLKKDRYHILMKQYDVNSYFEEQESDSEQK